VRWIILPLLAIALASVAGCRVDAQKCDQACRNMYTLTFWKKLEPELAAAPADQRDALRKQKTDELVKQLADGMEGCVMRCQSGRDTETVDCLLAAKTADQAIACSKSN
jgi:hypothetical protein